MLRQAVKQILHFMSEDNPFTFSEISLQAWAPGEQRKPRDKWGQGASSRQSGWQAVNPPALAGLRVCGENKINPPLDLTKAPSLLMAVQPGGGEA